MGNEQSMEENQSIRIANQTELPLVYVLSMTGPLYWGVLQPGDRVTCRTGRVWFTVTCYPYTGDNEPSEEQRVLGVLIPTAVVVITAATAGVAFAAAAPQAGTAAAALAPLVRSAMTDAAVAAGRVTPTVVSIAHGLKQEFVDAAMQSLNPVQKTGHYANGDWIHVRGGIKHNEPYSAWTPMRFEY